MLVECWICNQKVASLNPGMSSRRIFFSRANFVRRLLFSVSSTPVLLQWHVKDPSHSDKSADGRLHLNTHTPMPQGSQSGLTMPLSRYSVGTCPEMSSHTTCQGTLWTDPGLNSGISVHKLISNSKKERKKVQVGNKWLNILPKSQQASKKPPQPGNATDVKALSCFMQNVQQLMFLVM